MAAVVAAIMSHADDAGGGPVPQGSKARAEKRAQEEKQAVKMMSMVSNTFEVQKVRKKNNQVWDTSTEEGRQQAAAARIQHFARRWKNRDVKCHRENLGNRLIFEQDLKFGVVRLVTQVTVFALLLIAAGLSGDAITKSGIYQNLDNSFDFGSLAGLNDRDTFVSQRIPSIAKASKKYFLLSSEYFVPEGGTVNLWQDMTTFSAPDLVGGLELNMQVPEFSLIGIVKTSPQFVEGYLLRKRFVPAGKGTELACWGWYLHNARGPSFNYGGHDYYLTKPASYVGQEKVEMSKSYEIVPNNPTLMTVVVTQTDITFYYDLEKLESVTIPRPVTDCFNQLEGMLVGDTGLTIGQLKFYPKALTRTSIEEIYRQGSTLDEVSTGSDPEYLGEKEDKSGRSVKKSDLDRSVQDLQTAAEFNNVLTAVENNRNNLNARALSPSHPMGRIQMNQTVVTDTNNKMYKVLMKGPWNINQRPRTQDEISTRDAKFDGERYWHDDDFPNHRGKSLTYAYWFRNGPVPEDQSAGTFHIAFHDNGWNSDSRCYALFWETWGIWWDLRGGSPGFAWPLKNALNESYTKTYFVSENAWRHIAWSFDMADDTVTFYLDGQVLQKTKWGRPVGEMDCAPANVTIGHRYPEFTYHHPFEIYDMRMYVGSALTHGEIQRVMAEPTPGLVTGEKCFAPEDPALKDTAWKDTYGHGCDWYYDNAKTNPSVCNFPGAKDACPIACASKQECFNDPSYKAYFSWNSIRKIEPKSTNGSMCMSDKHDLNRVYDECVAFQSQMTETNLRDYLGDLRTALPNQKRLNLTMCEEVKAAMDEHCAFDSASVANVTREYAESGEMTIAFWVKPLNEKALEDGEYVPSVSFISTVSPPRSNLQWFRSTAGVGGEIVIRSKCGVIQALDGALRMPLTSYDRKAEPFEWQFMAFTLGKRGNNVKLARQMTNTFDFTKTSDGIWDFCPFDDNMLFNGIEVNYPVLMSPVMMVAKELPAGKLQSLYYDYISELGIRDGPILSARDRVKTSVPIEKVNYVPQSVLMASPLIFQTRAQPTSTCPYNYSTEWLNSQLDQVAARKCTYPNECDDEVLQDASMLMSCKGEAVTTENNRTFGLAPVEFGDTGFADFLFSITDQPYVFRRNQLVETSSFIDSFTQSIKIILCFFSPQYGTTTVLSVNADLSGVTSADVSIGVQHYSILEGSALQLFIIANVFVILAVTVMLLDVIYTIWGIVKRFRFDGHLPGSFAIVLIIVDLLSITTSLAVVGMSIPAKVSSAENVDNILGKLNSIPWASSEFTVDYKKATFFENVQAMISLMEDEESINSFLNFTLILILIRVIQCTGVHPRLALLTGTVSKAMDDFVHTALLIILIMGSFAGIATWRFGGYRPEFATWEISMQTEFMMMLGMFLAEDWASTTDMQAFCVLYLMVMFLLVLNFVLAIIVEAYMGVRKANEECVIEMDFISDCSWTLVSSLKAIYYGWPSKRVLGLYFQNMPAKFNISYDDLHKSGLFRTQMSMQSFLDHYKQFDFLEPVQIDAFGKVDPEAEEREWMRRLLHSVFEKRPPKLAELPAKEGAKARKKRLSVVSPIDQLSAGANMWKDNQSAGVTMARYSKGDDVDNLLGEISEGNAVMPIARTPSLPKD